MSRATRRTGRRSIPRGLPVSNKRGTSLFSMKSTRKGNQHAGGAMISTAIVLGMVVLFALGFGFLIITGHSGSVASASGGGPVGNVPTGYGAQNHAKGPCGNAGQAACPAVNPDWFAVPSASSNVVATAIASSKEYIAMQGRYGYMRQRLCMLIMPIPATITTTTITSLSPCEMLRDCAAVSLTSSMTGRTPVCASLHMALLRQKIPMPVGRSPTLPHQ